VLSETSTGVGNMSRLPLGRIKHLSLSLPIPRIDKSSIVVAGGVLIAQCSS
jgi:hypothetical protein